MKPDWKDAPEWANWLAMDADGVWWWHETRPVAGNVLWKASGLTRLQEAENSIDWRETLEQRP